MTIDFHADDYGLFQSQSERIIQCHTEGALSGISVLTNGDSLQECLALIRPIAKDLLIAVHLNFLQGHSLSRQADVNLLTDENGIFNISFGKLLVVSYSTSRNAYKQQLKTEIRAQISALQPFLREYGKQLRIDGHAHWHMIPVMFDALMEVIREDGFIYMPVEILSTAFGGSSDSAVITLGRSLISSEVLGGKGDSDAKSSISIVAGTKSARAFVEKVGLKSRRVTNCMIIGGGTIGYYLAQNLLESHIAVTIIEKDPVKCNMLSEEIPGANIICGDAANQNVLLEEGISKFESFVSLTGMDEENIFLSLYARKAAAKDVKLITKVNRINYDDIIDDMNLGSILNPQHIAAEYIVRYVRAMENSIGSNVETLYNIIENKAEALEFLIQMGSPVIGIPLINLPIKKGVLIACIYRNREIIIPNGQTMIEVDDRVIVVTTRIGFQDIRDILVDETPAGIQGFQV